MENKEQEIMEIVEAYKVEKTDYEIVEENYMELRAILNKRGN